MFENIGSKIKILAKVICWIGISISILVAIVLLASETVGGGLLTLIFGCLASWVGSFFTYGFGELIEKVTAIEKNMNKSKDYNNE